MTAARGMYGLVAAACLFRLALSSMGLEDVLVYRNELATPLTSWTRLKEGHFLATRLGQNPYDGGSFHHAPLLLLLGPLTGDSKIARYGTHIVWLLCDIATASGIAAIATRRKRALDSESGEQIWSSVASASIYLLHPFTIATSLAKSTTVFGNAIVVWSIATALEGTKSYKFSSLPPNLTYHGIYAGSLVPACFLLSLATHVSMYPALLLPPLVLVAQQSSATNMRKAALMGTVAFMAHQAAVLCLSRWTTGSWSFVDSVYKVALTVPDLTPTIGLAWYFFIEMFDHFRAFFVGVFQLHVLIHVAPLTYAFRRDPLFAIVLLVGVIAIFKSYPSLGDFGLWHGLLATYSEMATHLTRPLFLVCLMVYPLFLLPTFHHLWLYSGSGNANFFYASTLVWTISQIMILIDVLHVAFKRSVLKELSAEGRLKVKQGRWKIVQR
ncbi:hypothetical protein OIV83_001977 [Microbotryomycetes sp. JL201]|nr:hypothetical protein OIV83_001977 [Microbotryomycetes sp. JL201]